VVAANLTQLFTPDDRGYYKFNRSAIRFMPDFDFSKIRDDSFFIPEQAFLVYFFIALQHPAYRTAALACGLLAECSGKGDFLSLYSANRRWR